MQLLVKKVSTINRSFSFVNSTRLIEYDLTISLAWLTISNARH